MTPLDLYTVLSAAYPHHVVDSICCVETSCTRNGFCSDKQSYPVLNFDKVKFEFFKGQNIQMPPSVDAVCIGKRQKYICFVELKGWKNYNSYIYQQKKTIEETVEDYNLDGKLFDSQELCKQITTNPNLFADMPTIFLLVTDIDVKTHGIESFADNMFTLAGSSTDIYSQCISQSKKTLESTIHIDKDYICCKDFDKYIANI